MKIHNAATCVADDNMVRMTVPIEELRTIYFALREYQDKLEESVRTSKDKNPDFGTHIEDLCFLYNSLEGVVKLVNDIVSPPIPLAAEVSYESRSAVWRRVLDCI